MQILLVPICYFVDRLLPSFSLSVQGGVPGPIRSRF